VRRSTLFLLLLLLAILTAARANELFDKQIPESVAQHQRMHDRKADRPAAMTAGVPTERLSDVECVDGAAGPFGCDGVDLASFVPIEEFGGVETAEAAGFSASATSGAGRTLRTATSTSSSACPTACPSSV